jgi:hypothetical protein
MSKTEVFVFENGLIGGMKKNDFGEIYVFASHQQCLHRY